MNKTSTKQNLGTAMIVKNAEHKVAAAIKSIISVSEQIIVVDTGSDDSTPVVCTRLGAEVHYHKWTDSFSEARNHSIKLLRTDWVLILDADETLDINSFQKNKPLLDNEKIGGISVVIENILSSDTNSQKSFHKYTRIFRRSPLFHFEGKIHEQISPSIIASNYEIYDSEIRIIHYGYNERSEEKYTRNRNMLLSELDNKPDDHWLNYHLGETEFAIGNLEQAENIFLKIQNSNYLSIEQNEIILIRLAQIALKKENFDKIEMYINFRSKDVNKEGLRLYIKATNQLLQGNYLQAFNTFNSHEVKISTLVDYNQVEKPLSLLKLKLDYKE